MLSSLKKWVQDVTVDLTPPPQQHTGSPLSLSSVFSSSSISGSINNNFYSTKPFHEQQGSRDSTSSAVYLSRPVSMESVRSSRPSIVPIPPPPSTSPVELDLSHLNREEQEHIANVLRRARAVEEQQQSNLLPVTTVATKMSPTASVTSSISSSSTSSSSSSSSTTSTASFASEQLGKNDNEIQNDSEKSVKMPESTLANIYRCQTCSKEHRENSLMCFQCQEKDFIKREIESNITSSSQQVPSIKKSLSPISIISNNHKNNDKNDNDDDNIIIIDSETDKPNSLMHESRSNQNHIEHRMQENQSINSDSLRTHNLTEIDENEFFYEERSPYVAVIKSNKNDESIISSYHIDEFIEEDNSDERDHVKELEETIANLSRHFPSEQIENLSTLKLPMHHIDTNVILEMEMEIESPSVEEIPFKPSTSISNHSTPAPIPMNNRRINLSRSSGIRENLTDLLVSNATKTPHTLQRTLSTSSKQMLCINRQKRNLPSVPNTTTSSRLRLRRANSESRFSLPAVPLPILVPPQNLDDESDLLEINLNNPLGSMNRSLCSKNEAECNKSNGKYQYTNTLTNEHPLKVKQLRDQTTNTPPISNLNSSRKSKKKSKQKTPPPSNIINEQNNSSASPTVQKLQKSTSTEITYPFAVTKLILNPSRHGASTDFGFRITGGHSLPNCMEVTACIENINVHHRNYEILKNAVQEGDEVLELGGVSLRGKSALFVDSLMNTIQNEFEIVVRSRSTNINIDSLLTIDTSVTRRHSMDTSELKLNESTNNSNNNNTVTKSKSTSISSLHQTAKVMIDHSDNKPTPPLMATSSSNEKPSNGLLSHNSRSNLLPNDAGVNGVGSNISIDQPNSNESDESDSLSQYFHSSIKPKSNSTSKVNTSVAQGRSQSVIPLASDGTNASHRLQGFLKSDNKRLSKDSTNTERKSSLALASLQFLKKKTKSADFTHQKHTLINQLRENQYAGDIELQIRHDSEREQLVVLIIRAKNLLPKDTNGFSDPFVKVYLLPGRDAENKRRIKYVTKTLNPVWNHTVIYGNMHREELQYKKLEFTVWDYDRFKANDFLGQVTIDLKNPNAIDDKPHWYRLQALRSREEITNRSSSPRLNNLTLGDSVASSTSTINKISVNIQPRTNQLK